MAPRFLGVLDLAFAVVLIRCPVVSGFGEDAINQQIAAENARISAENSRIDAIQRAQWAEIAQKEAEVRRLEAAARRRGGSDYGAENFDGFGGSPTQSFGPFPQGWRPQGPQIGQSWPPQPQRQTQQGFGWAPQSQQGFGWAPQSQSVIMGTPPPTLIPQLGMGWTSAPQPSFGSNTRPSPQSSRQSSEPRSRPPVSASRFVHTNDGPATSIRGDSSPPPISPIFVAPNRGAPLSALPDELPIGNAVVVAAAAPRISRPAPVTQPAPFARPLPPQFAHPGAVEREMAERNGWWKGGSPTHRFA